MPGVIINYAAFGICLYGFSLYLPVLNMQAAAATLSLIVVNAICVALLDRMQHG